MHNSGTNQRPLSTQRGRSLNPDSNSEPTNLERDERSKDDDDVPVAALREQLGKPDWSLNRKQHVGIRVNMHRCETAAGTSHGAEFISTATEHKEALQLGSPERQCAKYVLGRIKAIPDYVWFAEPARVRVVESAWKCILLISRWIRTVMVVLTTSRLLITP